MSTIIAISNQKGGVGKTTTTNALTAGFQRKGFRTLAIDMDSQGNLSFSMGAENENVPTIYHVLKGDVSALEAIQHTSFGDVIPGNILLSGVELEFNTTGREFILREALEPLKDLYDYIFIDTPPALSILTVNAFTASQYIIIPMLADVFSLQGLTQLYDTIQQVRKYCNPSLKIEGILLTRFNNRTVLSRDITETARLISEQLNMPIFDTVIRNSVVITEAQSIQEDMYSYSRTNNAVKDYSQLIDELIARGI